MRLIAYNPYSVNYWQLISSRYCGADGLALFITKYNKNRLHCSFPAIHHSRRERVDWRTPLNARPKREKENLKREHSHPVVQSRPRRPPDVDFHQSRSGCSRAAIAETDRGRGRPIARVCTKSHTTGLVSGCVPTTPLHVRSLCIAAPRRRNELSNYSHSKHHYLNICISPTQYLSTDKLIIYSLWPVISRKTKMNLTEWSLIFQCVMIFQWLLVIVNDISVIHIWKGHLRYPLNSPY